MVSVCLPSDALLQHLLSYLGFSYLGHWISLHGCSSKAQPLLLTLDEGYLLTATLPDLQRGIASLGPPAPRSQGSLDVGLVLPATAPASVQRLLFPATALGLGLRGVGYLLPSAAPDLGRGVTPLVATPDLEHWVSPLGCPPPRPQMWGSSSQPSNRLFNINFNVNFFSLEK